MNKQIVDFRKKVLQTIFDKIEHDQSVLAAWEGGSAANDTLDEFSDIDLCVVGKSPIQRIVNDIETALESLQISHTWQPAKSFWGEGFIQRVIVLKDSPKYFSVDVGVFDVDQPKLMQDFLELERHGRPRVFFDKNNIVNTTHTNVKELFERQQKRVEEINSAFPIFKTLVLKEIERGNSIDAIAFYQNGLLRPLVEVLGMLIRPFKYDFGMRYIHRSFPKDDQMLIQELSYISDPSDLYNKVLRAEEKFNETVKNVRQRSSILHLG